jgi:uncharacterized Zn finger protein
MSGEELPPAAKSSTPAAKSSTPAAKSSTPAATSSTPAATSSTPAATSSTPAATSSTPAATSSTPAATSGFVRNSSFNTGPGVRPMRRPDTPRRLKNGIRLRRREGIDLLAWPADAWAALLLSDIEDTVKTEALDYARAGQTATLQITSAGAEATVQGRAARPYVVTITPDTIAPADWDRVVAIMAREAVYSAKLLAGEMPPLVEQPFASLGKQLVPTDPAAVTRTCTCDLPKPCKHMGCVGALLIERLAGDPLLAFTLRGLDGQRLLERLQEARAIATRGLARAHSTPPAVELVAEAAPLDRSIETFWRPGRQLDEAPSETEPFAPHALLRRLGQSPLQGKFPLVGLLASIYDSLAARGRELRERESDAPPPSDEEGDRNADVTE